MMFQHVGLDALLQARASHAGSIGEIDAELLRRGVRIAGKPGGRHDRAAAAAVYALLARAGAPIDIPSVVEATGCKAGAAAQLLHKMSKAGEIRRVERGRYALPEPPKAKPWPRRSAKGSGS